MTKRILYFVLVFSVITLTNCKRENIKNENVEDSVTDTRELPSFTFLDLDKLTLGSSINSSEPQNWVDSKSKLSFILIQDGKTLYKYYYEFGNKTACYSYIHDPGKDGFTFDTQGRIASFDEYFYLGNGVFELNPKRSRYYEYSINPQNNSEICTIKRDGKVYKEIYKANKGTHYLFSYSDNKDAYKIFFYPNGLVSELREKIFSYWDYTEFKYNEEGQVSEIYQHFIEDNKDTKMYKCFYDYDLNGYLIRKTYLNYNRKDPSIIDITISDYSAHDKFGHWTKCIESLNNKIIHSYERVFEYY